jgi:transposase
VRVRRIKALTALVNEIRGLLSEYGLALPQRMGQSRRSVVRQLEAAQAQLTPCSRALFRPLYEESLALGPSDMCFMWHAHREHYF